MNKANPTKHTVEITRRIAPPLDALLPCTRRLRLTFRRGAIPQKRDDDIPRMTLSKSDEHTLHKESQRFRNGRRLE